MTELKEIKTSCCFICITFAQIKEFLFYVIFSLVLFLLRLWGETAYCLYMACASGLSKRAGGERPDLLQSWNSESMQNSATKYKPRYLVGFSCGFFWGFWLGVYFPPGLLVWSLFKGLSLFHLS